MYPPKLKIGDEVRVIAPARSLGIISDETKKIANQRFADLGLKLTFGKHVGEIDDFKSSSIESRLEDLHQAFSDKNVKAMITVIGGFNSNQLLDYIDWNLIKKNPKILCGYSDITVLNNAIFAKTGFVTYSGPHYSSFGMKLHFDYTLEYFKKCLFLDEPFEILPSENWTDDPWYKDQEDRKLIKNNGWLVINEGRACGTILGSNLCTLNLLQGTKYFPRLKNSILFIEEDELAGKYAAVEFDRNLQSLIHQKDFDGVQGIIIGRFQKGSEISNDLLRQIIKSKKELNKMPVVADVDFGHTDPRITFPIGGKIELSATKGNSKIKIIKH
ncbi:MAG: peptidase S66 [Candidatus Buchananbacteria bacterium RIFCSPHIGHO2_01_FULL_44_11]|uniref:Peptidase S66 n=1 Tax=Candidatus Buchananbacteria bacterium RIFCSPHIGHO2_01_FULL_44_11 TaxID=1797535 RepID=A0A1G1Y0T6_9BACT|nr:MAG: peptidase S66 [Candidatus Buchananbacteria bacterium RIFCSPHIGHO2_01_FULL_44_11]